MQVLKMFLVDDIGSCGRVSCECDMAFVSDLSRVYFHQDHSNGQIKNTGLILKSFSSKVIQVLYCVTYTVTLHIILKVTYQMVFLACIQNFITYMTYVKCNLSREGF